MKLEDLVVFGMVLVVTGFVTCLVWCGIKRNKKAHDAGCGFQSQQRCKFNCCLRNLIREELDQSAAMAKANPEDGEGARHAGAHPVNSGVISVLQLALERNPELRLGQLINIALDEIGNPDLFHVSDQKLQSGLMKLAGLDKQ
jgi:hypothetical protein